MAEKVEQKKPMMDRYYAFVDKKSDSGGRTNLWINNAIMFGAGMLVEGKLLHVFSDPKKT